MKELLALEKFKADHLGNIVNVKTGKKIKTFRVLPNGYLAFNFLHSKRHLKIYAHRFVWTFFNGPIDDDKVIHHIDANRENNCLANLLKTTHKFNCNNKRMHLSQFEKIQNRLNELQASTR